MGVWTHFSDADIYRLEKTYGAEQLAFKMFHRYSQIVSADIAATMTCAVLTAYYGKNR